MVTVLWSLMLAGAAALPATAPVPKDLERANAQAKGAAEEFLKAMKAEDVQELMKVVDVPFFVDGKQVIKEREQVEALFIKVFRNKDLTQIDYTIKEVHPAAKLPDLVHKPQRELAEKTVGDTDRVVLVVIGKDTVVVLVRFQRDGKAKVSGFAD
ncbi:unnamed protein product [Gemmataceae bacterium]|nr:unnamed protein product [Gemmataceae bacterium]VTU02349.1 unnamed protein product [Gemmataceae bacterium]